MIPYRPPPVLVPRPLRSTVNERVDKEGSVRSPLDEAKVLAGAERFRDAGVGAIAACFLWSFPSPGHERRAAGILREALPGVYVSASFEVLPRIRGTTAWYVFGNRVAGSGLDRTPRERHGAESIHCGGEG